MGDDSGVLIREDFSGPHDAEPGPGPNTINVPAEDFPRDTGESPLSYEGAMRAIQDMNKEIMEDYCRRVAIRLSGFRSRGRKSAGKHRKGP